MNRDTPSPHASQQEEPAPTAIQTAELNWDDEGQPLSSHFGDVYFSKANGLEETRHVFLHHNQLAERFAALANTSFFTIGETGFGSGLNFLAAWDLWLKTAPETAQLHFVTVEKFPLRKADLIRALALWPELGGLAEQLIAAYPVFVGAGFHRLNFMYGRVKLTLIIDDAAAGFGKLLATSHPLFAHTGSKVDAWFLDGFAPSKNPQMWSDQLFDAIGRLSQKGTTAATFSAAAIVKHGLKRAGFSIAKVPGFGRKREMVKAIYMAEPAAPNPNEFINRRSFSPYPVPWTIQGNKPQFTEKQALVIGGGLAGCHSARALAERGWRVTIAERHDALAQEGSGNPQGALYAKLSHMDEAQSAFNLASLQYALNFYRPIWHHIGEQCGLLQLAHKPAELELQQQLQAKFATATELVTFVDAAKASELANTHLAYSGLFFPHAGWIDPRKLCSYLIDHPNIHVEHKLQIQQLQPADEGWILATNKGNLSAPVVIIANAKDAQDFAQANHLPIKAIRGQVSYFSETETSPKLKTVICAEGYISPVQDGQFCTGATFNLKDSDLALRETDQDTNLANLQAHIPAFARMPKPPLAGRAAFRCTLPDYLPAVGPLPQLDQLVEDFAPLRKNAKAGIATAGSYWPGLYINIGHGARGLTYTPLCAELLAAEINHEAIPIARDLANALHPARFIIRDIIRNKR